MRKGLWHRIWHGHWPLYRLVQGRGLLIYRYCARCEEEDE